MSKEDVVYGIFSGKVLMPFLIRDTRKEAIRAFVNWSGSHPTWVAGQLAGYSVKKLIIKQLDKEVKEK